MVNRTAFSVDIKPDEPAPPTRIERKMKRIFGSGKTATATFTTGFMAGAAVGGMMGTAVGCYQAYQMRSFLPIPVSILASGTSFGFFMGLGMTIRQMS